MAKRLFKKVNWFYAIGEILLIFIGITVAIWFNNYNEGQRAKEIEIQSLMEIKNGIDQDLKDISENVSGFRNRVKLFNKLIEHHNNSLPNNDSLQDQLKYLLGETTFLSHTGPYETLKSRGFQTITNDSLRKQIIKYYDFEHDLLRMYEKDHHDHFSKSLKPLMIKYFDLSSTKMIPLNYNQMISDKDFIQNIYWAKRNNSNLLKLYTKLQHFCEELVDNISKELNSLNTN